MAFDFFIGGTMYYLIDNDPGQRYNNVEDVLNVCVTAEYWEDDTDEFDEYLDEGNGIEIAGYDFSPSEVLREMNYDGYRRELQYWAVNKAEYSREDYRYELERADNGEDVWICDHRVYCYDDEVAEEDEYNEDEDGDKASFALLEERIRQQREQETQLREEDRKTENDFLSAIGIQVI